jgi:type IV secretory pathway VirB3-like protein
MVALTFLCVLEHRLRQLVQRYQDHRRFRRALARLSALRQHRNELYWQCKDPVAKKQLRDEVDALDQEIFTLKVRHYQKLQPKR